MNFTTLVVDVQQEWDDKLRALILSPHDPVWIILPNSFIYQDDNGIVWFIYSLYNTTNSNGEILLHLGHRQMPVAQNSVYDHGPIIMRGYAFYNTPIIATCLCIDNIKVSRYDPQTPISTMTYIIDLLYGMTADTEYDFI